MWIGLIVVFVGLNVAFGDILDTNPSSSDKIDISPFFVETFDSGDVFKSGRWIKSSEKDYADQQILIRPSKPSIVGFEEDNGLSLASEMKRYGVSAPFAAPLIPAEGNIVIQYELKLEESLSCGGAYVKLLRRSKKGNNIFQALNSNTPYSIMFGPDRCGNNNKVHFIIQYQNPVSKKWSEHHFNGSIPMKGDRKIHLYTLSITQNNAFTIYIDKIVSQTGHLLRNMDPPINPPSEIDDPEDKKPSTWEDNPEIDDPTAQKPEDWDENAPQYIPDLSATKPEGWLDNAPLMIPDPSLPKPADWDDEEDGYWEAPSIPNPECDIVGCGEWKRPMMPNPDYKGVWKPPKIPNPAYKGAWIPRQISNPSYFNEVDPFSHLAPMIGLAIEVWTTNAGIFFDNFFVGTEVEDAFRFADSTFVKKVVAEAGTEKEREMKKRRDEIDLLIESGEVLNIIQAYFMKVGDVVSESPITILSTTFGILYALYLLFASSSEASGKKFKRVEKENEDVKDNDKKED